MSEYGNNRIFYIDFIKAIGITLVILGHIQNHGEIYSLITSFHMPLFFMISGYFFIRPQTNLLNHLKKRWVNLIVPYIFFYLITYAYWALIEQNLRTSNGGVTAELWRPALGLFWEGCDWNLFPHNNPLWFIPCLFSVELLAFLCRTWSKIYQGFYALGLFGIAYLLHSKNIFLPFEIDLACGAFFFYWFGTIVRSYINSSKLLFIFVTTLIIYILSIYYGGYAEHCSLLSPNNNNILWFYYIAILSIIIVTISLKWIGIRLENFKFTKRAISFWGTNTLCILCVHDPIKRVVIFAYSKITNHSIEMVRTDIFESLICLLLIILILIPIILIYNKWIAFKLKNLAYRIICLKS